MAVILPGVTACTANDGFFFIDEDYEESQDTENGETEDPGDNAGVSDDESAVNTGEAGGAAAGADDSEDAAGTDDTEDADSGTDDSEDAEEKSAEAGDAAGTDHEYFDDALNGDDAFDIVVKKVVTADYGGNTSIYIVTDDGKVYDGGYVALDMETLLIEKGDSLRITATSGNVITNWDFTYTGEDGKVRDHEAEAEARAEAEEEAKEEEESQNGYGSLWWNYGE